MAPQLAHLMSAGAVRVETTARRISRRDLETFFLGTGCLAIMGHFLLLNSLETRLLSTNRSLIYKLPDKRSTHQLHPVTGYEAKLLMGVAQVNRHLEQTRAAYIGQCCPHRYLCVV